jgi:fucose permease
MKKWFINPDVITFCNLSMFSMAIASNLPAVYLTTFDVAFGPLSAERLGRIGSFVFIGYCLGLLLSTYATRHLRVRHFVLAGNFFVALSLVFLAASPAYSALLLSVLFGGFGAGIIELIASPIISTLEPERRTSALNKLHAFYSVGAAATISICSVAIYFHFGWRPVTLCFATLPILCFVGFTLVPLPQLVADEIRTRVRDLVKRKSFILCLFAILAAGAAELGTCQWLAAYAQKSLHYKPFIGGLALLGFFIGMSVGRFGASWLTRFIDPLRILAACAVAAIILLSLAAFCPMPAPALAAGVCTGLAVSCMWPTTLGIVANDYPRAGATMFGFLSIIGNFGGVIMPWLVGFTADRTGSLHYGMATIALAPLALAVIIAVIARRSAAPAQTPVLDISKSAT